MDAFQYAMPTKVYFGKDCVLEHREQLAAFGDKALILTGKSSAKKNGAQKDVTTALESGGVRYVVFDGVEENPSYETVLSARELGLKEACDFVIGIGGGSPMDAAKSVACLLADPDLDPEALFGTDPLDYVPIVEIPTTAGTGSEVTQYSILTLHKKQTKASVPQQIFADAAFLDAKYMLGLNNTVTVNTAVDALSHLIEGYLAVKANFFSDCLAEAGFRAFADCIAPLRAGDYSLETREKLLLSSTLAGMVIAQAGTSLPHLLGYGLTYFKGVPHGRANGILTPAYLRLFGDSPKIAKLLCLLGFADLDALAAFLKEVLAEPEVFTEAELKQYTAIAMENPAKLGTFPRPLSESDVYGLYAESLLHA